MWFEMWFTIKMKNILVLYWFFHSDRMNLFVWKASLPGFGVYTKSNQSENIRKKASVKYFSVQIGNERIGRFKWNFF